MNIIHRISFSKDENLFYRFEKNNIKIKKGLINYFDIGENDKNWSFVKSLIRKYSTVIFDNQYKTEFSKKEFDQAACFILTPEWHFEYPQPEEDFGYQHLTYDDSFACYSCGVGFRRKNLFKLKREPDWGKREIVQLNWVFDEFFVSKRLKEQLINRFNINFFDVIKYKKEEVFNNIFNIQISDTVSIINKEMLEYKRCPICGKIKYKSCTNGFYPCIRNSDACIVKTEEYFGSGKSAFQRIIINRDMYEFFITNNIKGIGFIPMKIY